MDNVFEVLEFGVKLEDEDLLTIKAGDAGFDLGCFDHGCFDHGCFDQGCYDLSCEDLSCFNLGCFED